MPSARDAVAGAPRGPTLRRLLVRLVIAMQVPLLAAGGGLLVSFWDNEMDHALDDMRAATTSLAFALQREAGAAPEPRRLREVLAATYLPAGWSASVAGADGAVVAHSEHGVDPPDDLLLAARGTGHGRTDWVSSRGYAMITYFHQTPASPWTTFVTVPRDVLLRPVWRAALLLLLAQGAVVAATLFAAVRLGRRIADPIDVLRTAASGQEGYAPARLPAHTFREAGELAAALESSSRAVAQAIAAMLRSERRLDAVLRTAGNAVIVADSAQRILLFNDAAHCIFGQQRPGFVGLPLAGLFSAKSWACLQRRCSSPEVAAGATLSAHAVCVRTGGTHFPAELLVSQFADAQGERFCTLIVRDITQRLRANRALHAAQREVQDANDRLQRTLLREMDERMTLIARELHDSVGSALAGISMLAAGGRARADDAWLSMTLGRIQEQVHATAERVRQISHGIMPAGSEAGALLPALEQYAHDVAAARQVACRVRWRGDFDGIPPAVAGHVYRVVQEATANALRHGAPSRIRIRLAQAGPHYRLAVADDGNGWESARARAGLEGLGVKSMHARAAAIDGKLDIRSRPGGGCRVRLTWRAKRAGS